MRRSLLGVFWVSLLALTPAVACTTETIVVQAGPPEPETPDVPTTPADASADTSTVTKDPLTLDLGDVKTGIDVSFDVPVGALGFNITVEGQVGDFDPEKPFGIERITDPTGKVVHDNFTPDGGTNPTSFAAFDTIAAASVPQSENVSDVVPSGTWKVRFGAMNNPTANLTLKPKVRVQSSGDGVFHGGTLDLTLHVPPGVTIDGATLDAKQAETSAAVGERVDLFYSVMSQLLGIERGTVSFLPASKAFVDLDDNEVVEGFAASTGTADGTQSLHVLLTNSIRQGGQSVALGISPGIPGAAGIFGRGVSGIIVVAGEGAQGDALTMAHEFGHFIGLNHTAELRGDSKDPLSDTPACPAATLANQDLLSCPDRNNIMFVAGAIAGPLALSPTQKRVYQGSPIYKALGAGASNARSSRENGAAPLDFHRTFRASHRPLSAVESELSLGFCGLNVLDAAGLVKRHGYAAAVRELRAAAVDHDLAPFIRGRAALALQKIGLSP